MIMAKRKPAASLAGQLDMFGDWPQNEEPVPEPKGEFAVPLPKTSAVEPVAANANSAPPARAKRNSPPSDTQPETPTIVAVDVQDRPPRLQSRAFRGHGRNLGDLDARALLRAPDLAELLGLTLSTLAKLRCSGKGPPFYKLTNQTVGYKQEEVMAWLSERRRESTWTIKAR